MSCEHFELELSGPEPSAEAVTHAQRCASCRETMALVHSAALPELSSHEQLMVEGIAPEVERIVRARQAPARRGGWWQQAARLSVAAGIGAVVASAAILQLRPSPEPRVITERVYLTPPEVPVLDVADELGADNLSDDEVFFEVGWPSPTEGDL